ncbi:MAG: hypothetical protein D6B27_08340 [Gammaproteobacteria bacterium]|nr:MAG: hypothetical protein D6B27_08340 [Gammaproteobacteria bacterium]
MRTIPVLSFLAFVFSASVVFASDVKLYVALDTSGSMRNKHAWLEEMFFSMSEALIQREYGEMEIEVYSFTEKSSLIMTGPAEKVADSFRSIRVYGGTEDGLIPIQQIASKNILAGAHVLLITDEPRTEVVSVDFELLMNTIKRKNIIIHAITWAKLTCGANRLFAIDGSYQGLTSQMNRIDCSDEYNFDETNNQYYQAAILSGGKIWSMQELQKSPSVIGDFLGQELADKYNSAFVADVEIIGELFKDNPVTFDASNIIFNVDVSGPINWEWDYNNDGITDDYGPVAAHIFNEVGDYQITLLLSNQNEPSLKVKQVITIEVREQY